MDKSAILLAHGFVYAIGDEVVVSPPHCSFWSISGTVVELIQSFEYPTGNNFTPSNLLYLPGSRKWGTTTRKKSYLIKIKGVDEHIWATKDCIKKDGAQ